MTREPKVALVTTTINTPHVLSLYRAHGPDVAFFVALDEKTNSGARDYCEKLGNCRAYTVTEQMQLGYKCSDLIGWNVVARRNIATLEALKWGADILVFVDDDNLPMNSSYFESFISALSYPFDGLCASTSVAGWFDVGQLLDLPVSHRGFPIDAPTAIPHCQFDPELNVKVGVAAGICLGDPDTNAWDRISQRPEVHQVSELLRNGIVVERDTWTVFNTQNTAVIRELAPAMFLCPQFGRYDDIFASLVCQRVMRELDYHVHFGQPFVWQQRNPHLLINDLKAELFGAEYILDFADYLDGAAISRHVHDVTGMVAVIYEKAMHSCPGFPKDVLDLSRAWIADVESVL